MYHVKPYYFLNKIKKTALKLFENANFNESKQKCKLSCKSTGKMKSNEYLCHMIMTVCPNDWSDFIKNQSGKDIVKLIYN